MVGVRGSSTGTARPRLVNREKDAGGNLSAWCHLTIVSVPLDGADGPSSSKFLFVLQEFSSWNQDKGTHLNVP